MNAEEFSNQSLSGGSLVYPPYYYKGKNGAYYDRVCFVPEQKGFVDYAYSCGVYVDFQFSGIRSMTVYVDGDNVLSWSSTKDVNDYLDNTEKTAFELWVSSFFNEEESHELFETFFKQGETQ